MAPQQTLALLALLVSLQPVRAKPHSIIVAPETGLTLLVGQNMYLKIQADDLTGA